MAVTTKQALVRNFCIIAHIDHGKSTLADRLLEHTGAISQRDMQDQVLDTMDLERERGITIKLQAVRMQYPAKDGQTYELNLIDTPGHVDFAYEVSRSLAACEGAILVVDAAQGIEAQTLANLYQAVEAGLTIVPVVNKIDLDAAQPEMVAEEISDVTGIARDQVIFASAKLGIGTEDILEAVVNRVPSPRGDPGKPLRALIFDSHYDPYRGVITYVRVVDGEILPRTKIRMMNTDQVLDTMDLERERGITIKLQAVRMQYPAMDGQTYELNLIDTPGHVDFAYEVSRSLAACEGAILVVDAAQGIEAQTLANLYQAVEAGLTIVPVVNKIDLDAAQPEMVAEEISDVTGIARDQVIFASAKLGIGTEDILEAIVNRVPAPRGDPGKPLRALIFDSHYDPYRGVITYVRVVDGEILPRTKIRMMNTDKVHEVDEVGWFSPRPRPAERLTAGEVGYVTAAIKNVIDARVGDTITTAEHGATTPLPGYRRVKPMVFAGLFPSNSEQFGDLKEALEKLQLNDGALSYEPENSAALGFGFRCGFLGLLHLEIVQERLEREFELDLITTAPTVEYEVKLKRGGVMLIDNPALLPDSTTIETISEPYVKLTIITPSGYVGPMMELSQDRRGTFKHLEHRPGDRVVLEYETPLGEIIHDFYDQLKSRSKGYASMDYEMIGFREGDLVKLDVLVAGEPVDALSLITHRSKAQIQGRKLVEKLKSIIPRQLYLVPIQAAIGGKIIARETIPAMRKDVLAKCYGGDVTRKRKLLEKQKEGKKRMKRVGSVEIPQEAFMAVLKLD